MNFGNDNDYDLIPPKELCRRVRNNDFTNQELSDYVDFLYTLPRYIRNEYARKFRNIFIINDYEADVILSWDPPEMATIFMARVERWESIKEQITKTTNPERTTTDTAEGLRLPNELNTDTAEGLRLPEQTTTDTAEGLRLPDELNTERARKYFARAVEAKFMKLTPTGAKWLKPLARLGYLCFKIYPQPRPITALEKYFNVRKLSSNITNASIDARRADVIKWRAEIDKIFID